LKPKERILAKALELFNANGIEYVGMRELAASLGTKLGNITYYFATKEELVGQLSLDLSALNSTILLEDETISITSFLDMSRRHFEVQYSYRCLFLSFVHIFRQYSSLSQRYKPVEAKRKETGRRNIENLIRNKYLRELSTEETDFLISSISLISRFWISEAAISHNKLKPAQQISYYINMIASILLPYCTAKGKKDLQIS
jgi:AcrR family transcriptional regulator